MCGKVTCVVCVVMAVLLCAMPASATVIVIGPGSNVATVSHDDVAQLWDVTTQAIDGASLGVTLAGTYNVTDFSFKSGSGGAGTATPFLATLSGSTATPLWVGPGLDGGTVAGTLTDAYSAGSQQFVLSGSTVVYAGFYANRTGTAMDLVQVASFAGYSYLDTDAPGPAVNTGKTLAIPNARTYAFQIDVQKVPEPGALVLLGTALIGLLAYAWRKRR